MKPIYALIVLVASTTFAQKSFDFTTSYKQNYQNEYVSENFSFSYNSILKKITFIDKDLHMTNIVPVNYFDSRYTASNDIYVIGFSIDRNKFLLENKELDNTPALFMFFFNKKLGNLIKVEVSYVTVYDYDNVKVSEKEVFYTSEGKDFFEKL